MTQQIAEITKVPTIEAALRSLGQLYTFRRPKEVSQFVDTHPFLVSLLVEAHGKIAQHFGPSPEVILEVVTDPEASGDRELVAFIRTNLPPEEALDQLERFDEDWWLEASHNAQGNLCIHLEFP